MLAAFIRQSGMLVGKACGVVNLNDVRFAWAFSASAEEVSALRVVWLSEIVDACAQTSTESINTKTRMRDTSFFID